ncbi:MAG: histidinol-phosphate transaminase [Paenibacillaceae bacterium]|nr:histidinol-phosphate transaminase [Paenibacillaceae bacterium]
MEKMSTIKPRPALQALETYSPGKPIWEVEREFGLQRVIKLASNENPLGPSSMAIAAIRDTLADLHRYPDAQAVRLREALAAHHRLDPAQLIVGNGADELITLISETFLQPEDEVLVPSPSFGEYEFGGKLMDAKVIRVPLTDSFEYDLTRFLDAITARTKIVYLCSPNNPTGTYIPRQPLLDFLNKLPDRVLTVLDGAYAHYADAADFADGIAQIALETNSPLLALRTFSKIYGLAGLRIGYGIASGDLIEQILRGKEPFNVNSLAQAAAVAALADKRHVNDSLEVNRQGRAQLSQAFDRLGISYTKTMANFILAHFGPGAPEIYEKLLQSGIIVRKGTTWGVPEHMRITIGTKEDNEALIAHLELLVGGSF